MGPDVEQMNYEKPAVAQSRAEGANSNEGLCVNSAMNTKVSELIGAIRSINRAKRHEVKIDGDDEPCYWQRKEWVDWILELANEAEAELLTHNGTELTGTP